MPLETRGAGIARSNPSTPKLEPKRSLWARSQCRYESADINVGSGVVIGAQGEVLTNAHVVRNCSQITVHLHRQKQQHTTEERHENPHFPESLEYDFSKSFSVRRGIRWRTVAVHPRSRSPSRQDVATIPQRQSLLCAPESPISGDSGVAGERRKNKQDWRVGFWPCRVCRQRACKSSRGGSTAPGLRCKRSRLQLPSFKNN